MSAALKPAYQKDEASFATSARRFRGAFRLWWLGQSGFILVSQGHILLDPTFPVPANAGSDKPHDRITERVVDPAAWGFGGYRRGHQHHLHTDRPTVRPADRARMQPSSPPIDSEANRSEVQNRLGSSWTPASWALMPASLSRSAALVHRNNRGAQRVEQDAQGRCRFWGMSYVREQVFYHSGDTLWHEGWSDSECSVVDIAFLPGNRPERRVAKPRWPPGRRTKNIQAKLAILSFRSIHFNTASPRSSLPSAISGPAIRSEQQGRNRLIMFSYHFA
jgi:L-ascorbate metabolism protein UlaG (beta-lactamase superfamily)